MTLWAVIAGGGVIAGLIAYGWGLAVRIDRGIDDDLNGRE